MISVYSLCCRYLLFSFIGGLSSIFPLTIAQVQHIGWMSNHFHTQTVSDGWTYKYCIIFSNILFNWINLWLKPFDLQFKNISIYNKWWLIYIWCCVVCIYVLSCFIVLLYYNCCFIIIYMHCSVLAWTCWIWDKYNTVQYKLHTAVHI